MRHWLLLILFCYSLQAQANFWDDFKTTRCHKRVKCSTIETLLDRTTEWEFDGLIPTTNQAEACYENIKDTYKNISSSELENEFRKKTPANLLIEDSYMNYCGDWSAFEKNKKIALYYNAMRKIQKATRTLMNDLAYQDAILNNNLKKPKRNSFSLACKELTNERNKLQCEDFKKCGGMNLSVNDINKDYKKDQKTYQAWLRKADQFDEYLTQHPNNQMSAISESNREIYAQYMQSKYPNHKPEDFEDYVQPEIDETMSLKDKEEIRNYVDEEFNEEITERMEEQRDKTKKQIQQLDKLATCLQVNPMGCDKKENIEILSSLPDDEMSTTHPPTPAEEFSKAINCAMKEKHEQLISARKKYPAAVTTLSIAGMILSRGRGSASGFIRFVSGATEFSSAYIPAQHFVNKCATTAIGNDPHSVEVKNYNNHGTICPARLEKINSQIFDKDQMEKTTISDCVLDATLMSIPTLRSLIKKKK